MAIQTTGTGGSFDPAKTPGTFGQPPANAPQAVADNSPAAIMATPEQVAMARKFEQELAPLTYADSAAAAAQPKVELVYGEPPVQGSAPAAVIVMPDAPKPAGQPIITSSVKPPDVPRANRRLRPTIVAAPAAEATNEAGTGTDAGGGGAAVAGVDLPAAGGPAALVAPTATKPQAPAPIELGLAAAARQILTEKDLQRANGGDDQPYRPAQSNTDSPSRGLPSPVTDQGKRITGGFGDVGEAQYFPLDGAELRLVAEGLLDQLRARLQDDLRFSIAITYPRVAIRLELIVDAFGQDKEQVIPAVAVPHTKTPLEVAREFGDQIVFILAEVRQEFDDAGEASMAPNALRAEVGAEIPFKRPVTTAGGTRMMVDRNA